MQSLEMFNMAIKMQDWVRYTLQGNLNKGKLFSTIFTIV